MKAFLEILIGLFVSFESRQNMELFDIDGMLTFQMKED